MNMRELWTKAKFRGCRREFYISFLPSLLAYITGLNTALRNVQGNGKNIHLFSELFVLEYKHLQHSTPPPTPSLAHVSKWEEKMIFLSRPPLLPTPNHLAPGSALGWKKPLKLHPTSPSWAKSQHIPHYSGMPLTGLPLAMGWSFIFHRGWSEGRLSLQGLETAEHTSGAYPSFTAVTVNTFTILLGPFSLVFKFFFYVYWSTVDLQCC